MIVPFFPFVIPTLSEFSMFSEGRRSFWPSAWQPGFDLFVISFLALFFELACIRWFGATVALLTFFTNTVLLASFLGLSVGLLCATRNRNWIAWTLPLSLLASLLALGILALHEREGGIRVAAGDQSTSQEVFFGTELTWHQGVTLQVPIELVATVFFGLIALMFVGIGQEMGRRFAAIENRVFAYSIDILGSLAGILCFAALSWFQLSALTWFAISGALIVYALPRAGRWQVAALLGLLLVVASAGDGRPGSVFTFWSPYYKVDYQPATRVISTNNIGHQQMIDQAPQPLIYALTHLINREGGGQPFRDVLVIGAGSGNDVAAALRAGAERVDAVEIDPVLQGIGRRDHPNQPYQDGRVTVHITDGRGFLRRTDKTYDLIVYALVDSLVLQSGYSSLRLESFLFTGSAFDDIAARLKPGGVFLACNYYRRPWVAGRVRTMMAESFGTEPLALAVDRGQLKSLEPTDQRAGRFSAMLVAKGDNSILSEARVRLQEGLVFQADRGVDEGLRTGQWIRPTEPTPIELGSASSDQEDRQVGRLPTDAWPFLYLRDPSIPDLTLRGMILIALVALILLGTVARLQVRAFDAPMFFLGAGFMLLETKGVVHLALLFGSTWVVNSIVFASILVMVLIGNVIVLVRPPKRLWPAYLGLFFALLANVLVPLKTYLGLPELPRAMLSCSIVFLPILFAAILFATIFRERPRPEIALGSNLAGILVGGLSENLSLVLGFDNLLWVAIGFYALSVALANRR